ncbi:MAG: hypothetical protein IPG47_14720 [Thermoflexaceae bacterium]|nr:hypothetical protein [Thermoflexaceae bacterium]
MFAQMPAGVVLFDFATGQMTGNPQVGASGGWTPAPSGPMTPACAASPSKADRTRRTIGRCGVCSARGRRSRRIIHIVRGDGTDGYLNVNAGPVRDPTARWWPVLAFEDITAFVQAERTLHETYSQLTHLYEAAPVGLAFLSPDMRFERVNQALAEMNGTTIEEQTGRTLRRCSRTWRTRSSRWRTVLARPRHPRGRNAPPASARRASSAPTCGPTTQCAPTMATCWASACW